jgi:hypothetical protein
VSRGDHPPVADLALGLRLSNWAIRSLACTTARSPSHAPPSDDSRWPMSAMSSPREHHKTTLGSRSAA